MRPETLRRNKTSLLQDNKWKQKKQQQQQQKNLYALTNNKYKIHQ